MELANVYRLKESLALLRRIHHATAKKHPVPNSRRGEQEISLPSLKLSLWDQVGKGKHVSSFAGCNRLHLQLRRVS